MEIELDRKSPTPLHLQIVHRLRNLILNGAIPEGGRLPPDTEARPRAGGEPEHRRPGLQQALGRRAHRGRG